MAANLERGVNRPSQPANFCRLSGSLSPVSRCAKLRPCFQLAVPSAFHTFISGEAMFPGKPLVVSCLSLAILGPLRTSRKRRKQPQPPRLRRPHHLRPSRRRKTKTNHHTRRHSSVSSAQHRPANMGGRTADVEGVPGDPSTVYGATGSGGLWKTTNGGVTWKPISNARALSPSRYRSRSSNTTVVWVGTGESNTRNSVSFGDGMYKSTNARPNWHTLGLKRQRTNLRHRFHRRIRMWFTCGALGQRIGQAKNAAFS